MDSLKSLEGKHIPKCARRGTRDALLQGEGRQHHGPHHQGAPMAGSIKDLKTVPSKTASDVKGGRKLNKRR
jgi:hypothetical protein